MDRWISIAAVTVATTVAACTASEQSFKIQPSLSLDGRAITDNGAADYAKGKQLLAQGRFARAAQAFQAALFAGGPSIKILNALAVSYDELGRYDLSDRYYQRAVELDPNNLQTANNIAVSLARRGAPDIAAKVLAIAQTQHPGDTRIADNLKRAQAEAIASPATVAKTPMPNEIDNSPQLPRIEQTSPSTQELITKSTARDNIRLAEAPVPTPTNSREMPTPIPSEADKVQIAAVSRPTTGSSAVVNEPKVSAPAVIDKIHKTTVGESVSLPAVVTEALAPPPAVLPNHVIVEQHSSNVSQASSNAALADLRATKAIAPMAVASHSPSTNSLPASSDSSLAASARLALVKSRLGARISESENLQPADIAGQVGATELAMERLGARLEIANGAGRRYMAARMRSFLEAHGFDVSRVANAQNFDHDRTVIAYRDEFQPAAMALAKMLTTNVELRHVADLPVDIRLILGRDLLAFDHTLENGG